MIRQLMYTLGRFLRDRHGTSAVEYTLLVVGIGVTVMAAINFVSAEIVNVQTTVTDAIQN